MGNFQQINIVCCNFLFEGFRCLVLSISEQHKLLSAMFCVILQRSVQREQHEVNIRCRLWNILLMQRESIIVVILFITPFQKFSKVWTKYPSKEKCNLCQLVPSTHFMYGSNERKKLKLMQNSLFPFLKYFSVLVKTQLMQSWKVG